MESIPTIPTLLPALSPVLLPPLAPRSPRILGLGLLGLAPVVRRHAAQHKAVGDAQDEEEPKQVERLQRAEQGEGDPEGQRALVLARLPVDLVGADRLELGEEGEEDAQVEVVAQVDPDDHEGEVVGAGEGVVEVVEGFGGLGKGG